MTSPIIEFAPSKSSVAKFIEFDSELIVPSSKTWNKGQYDVFVVLPGNGRLFDISQFVISISYNFDFRTPWASIDIVFNDPTNVGRFLTPGNWVLIYGPYWNNSDPLNFAEFGPGINPERFILGDGQGLYNEIDRAQIVTVREGVGDNRTILAQARDPAWLLQKNKIPYRLPQGTLTERLRFVASQFGLPLREPLVETSHVIPATRGGKQSIWEDIQFDLSETNKIEDKRYVFRHRKGIFYLQEITNQERMWSFEIGSNIMSLTHERSIEEHYNIIYVLSNEDSVLANFSGLADDPTSDKIPFTGFAEDINSIDLWGRHILITNAQLDEESPTAQLKAENLLKKFNKIHQTASLTSFSMNGIRWGDQILIFEPATGLSGVFWVRAGSHSIVGASATMQLDIDFDFVVPNAVRIQQEDALSALFGAVGSAAGDLSPAELEKLLEQSLTGETE